MAAITSDPKGAVRASFDAQEAAVLRNLIDEMATVLAHEGPDDPIQKRLFPEAYESTEDSRKFADLIGDDLRQSKLGALQAMERTLGERGTVDASITEHDAEAWLAALTDLRLAIGTRLGVTEETMSSEIDPDDPSAATLAVLHWLGWLQESMIAALND